MYILIKELGRRDDLRNLSSQPWHPLPIGHRCKVLGNDTGESDGDTTRNSACEFPFVRLQAEA